MQAARIELIIDLWFAWQHQTWFAIWLTTQSHTHSLALWLTTH